MAIVKLDSNKHVKQIYLEVTSYPSNVHSKINSSTTVSRTEHTFAINTLKVYCLF